MTLGLNFKESHEISRVLSLPLLDNTQSALKASCEAIRQRVGIDTVMVHPTESAACATPEGTFWVEGPFCKQPKITTGAGDHCNAGFTTAQMLGMSPEACLTLGVSTSGYYVRTAVSPDFNQLKAFIRQWQAGEV